MRFNLIDLAVLAYVAFSVWRGRKRTFAVELPKLISVTLAVVAGGGLFRWTERLLEKATFTAGISSGPVTVVGIVIGALFLVRHFRARIRQWATDRYPAAETQRRWGMIAGGLRGVSLCALVVILGGMVPIGEFRKPFTRGSLFGYTVTKLLRPIYQVTREKNGPTTTRSAPPAPEAVGPTGGVRNAGATRPARP